MVEASVSVWPAAILVTDVLWALLIAGVVWGAGWAVLTLVAREADRPARPIAEPYAAEPRPVEPPRPAVLGSHPTPSSEEEHLAGVLRWLVAETEADMAAFVRLSPGGEERLVVEPRGLVPSAVAELARAARQALLGAAKEPPAGTAVARWLGNGGSKLLLLRGVLPGDAAEPLRFARFAIEWAGAPAPLRPAVGVEERIRGVPGVAWVEAGRDPSEVRALVAENVDRGSVEEAVEAVLRGTGVRVRWIDPVLEGSAPRARLIEVSINGNGLAEAQVALEWRGQELRGRGHAGRGYEGGDENYRAAADAAADALGPLLAGDVAVEGLYTHNHDEGDVVVVVVSLDGERLVGAVQARERPAGASAARAVLDAVNRRLSVMAGGSGRI